MKCKMPAPNFSYNISQMCRNTLMKFGPTALTFYALSENPRRNDYNLSKSGQNTGTIILKNVQNFVGIF